MKSNTKLFIVGEAFPHLGDDSWMFVGIFDSETKARRACYNTCCFVAPAKLNENLGDEITGWPGAYYPHVDH